MIEDLGIETVIALVFFGVIIAVVIFLKLAQSSVGTMPYRFSDGGRAAAGYRGKSGDCVTRAIALASGYPYHEVYNTVNAYGLSEGRRRRYRSSADGGVHRDTMGTVMAHYGGRWSPGGGMRLTKEDVPQGRIVVRFNGHVSAVIDGVIYDTGNPQHHGMRKVYEYWTFTEAGQ